MGPRGFRVRARGAGWVGANEVRPDERGARIGALVGLIAAPFILGPPDGIEGLVYPISMVVVMALPFDLVGGLVGTQDRGTITERVRCWP